MFLHQKPVKRVDMWILYFFCFCWSSLISSPEPKAHKVSLYYSKAPSSVVVVVHTFEQLYLQDQLANFSQILSVASLGWGKGCIRFWGRSDQNCGYHGNRKLPLTYNGQNCVPAFSQWPLIRSLSNLQVTRTGIKSRMSSNLGQVGLFTTELFALECSHWLWMGKMGSPSFLSYYEFSLHQSYRHKISDEFEFRSYLTSHFGVTCLWAVKRNDVYSFSH